MTRSAIDLERLSAIALTIPGAVERATGWIKFPCPACRAEGHDEHGDNAGFYVPTGVWGCALETTTRDHWAAIAQMLDRDALARAPRALEAIDLHTLLDRTFPDDPGIVGGGVIPSRALVILGGDPKLGKSWLALNLMLKRAAGARWLGLPTTPGCTLLLSAETSEPGLQRRLGILLGDREPPAAGLCQFVCSRRIKLDQPEGRDAVAALVAERRPTLLILDPLACFMSGDENSTRDMQTFVDALFALMDDYAPLAILVIHHRDKGGRGLRGSGVLLGALDTALMLTKRKTKNDDDATDDDAGERGFTLEFDLREGEPLAPLSLRRDTALWYHVDDARTRRALGMLSPPQAALVQILAPGPLRWSALKNALRDSLGMTDKAAERLIDRSVQAHVIGLDAQRRYIATPPDSPDEAVADSLHQPPGAPLRPPRPRIAPIPRGGPENLHEFQPVAFFTPPAPPFAPLAPSPL